MTYAAQRDDRQVSPMSPLSDPRLSEGLTGRGARRASAAVSSIMPDPPLRSQGSRQEPRDAGDRAAKTRRIVVDPG